MYDIRGKVSLFEHPQTNAIKALSDGITEIGGEVQHVTNRSFEFSPPRMYRWNLLDSVSRGVISIVDSPTPAVEYRISLFRTRVVCTLLSLGIVVLLFALVAAGQPRLILVYAPPAIVMVWGGGYGGNWLSTSLRFRFFVEETLKKLQ